MKLKILAVMMANLLLFFSGMALAEEKKYEISGQVDLGLRAVDDLQKSAKFQEYRDLRDGAYGNFYLNAHKGGYYLDLTGENVGLDDQYYQIKGGRYGSFKYSFYYNEIIHNLSFGAKTFYTGVGGPDLNYSATNRAVNTDAAYTPNIPTDPSLWSTFDYKTKRKDLGGAINLSFGSPFFLKAEASHVETNGVMPSGAPSGVFADRIGVQGSPFGNVVEMPAPVDYVTNTLAVTAGYTSKPFIFYLKGSYSKFENNQDWLRWRNPYVTTTSVTEVTSLASDNDYWNLSAQGVLRLPLDSALAVKGSYAKLENSLSLLRTVPSATSGGAATTPTYIVKTLGVNQGTFQGDISYTTASVAFTSQPIDLMGLKAYYKYLRKKNDSSHITYTDPVTGLTADNHLFDYDKNNAGLDLGFKLPAKFKFDTGYEYLVINRTRADAETTKDHTVYGEIKNSYLDFLTAKLRYQRLWRTSVFNSATAGTAPSDPNYIRRFLRRFDATDKTQDALKAGLEISPVENLDFGVDYIYKQNKYEETRLGVTKDERHEVYLDASFAMPGIFKLTAFFDYETVKSDSDHRTITPPLSNDPSAPPVSGAFNWSNRSKDINWAVGLAGEVPVIKNKLTLMASWTHEKADGQADFVSQNNFGLPINITEYDDYVRQLFHVKATYNLIPSLSFTLGYAYEKLKYSDAQYNGYTYVVASPPNTFLSGAYQDHSYEANILYLMTSYKF